MSREKLQFEGSRDTVWKMGDRPHRRFKLQSFTCFRGHSPMDSPGLLVVTCLLMRSCLHTSCRNYIVPSASSAQGSGSSQITVPWDLGFLCFLTDNLEKVNQSRLNSRKGPTSDSDTLMCIRITSEQDYKYPWPDTAPDQCIWLAGAREGISKFTKLPRWFGCIAKCENSSNRPGVS